MTNGLCEHSRPCEHCDFFFVSTSRDKKFALRAASSLDSTNRKQRALLIFSPCNNPYGNPFFFFFFKKQKIFYNGGRTSAEGPHGVPSSETISGTRITLEALKRIQRKIEALHWDYVSKINVKRPRSQGSLPPVGLVGENPGNEAECENLGDSSHRVFQLKQEQFWKNPKASKPFLLKTRPN